MNARIEVRRPWGALGRMGIVAGMHVAIVFVVAGALVIRNDAPPEPIEGVVIDEPPVIDDPPPATEPTFDRPDIYIPAPVVQFDPDVPAPPDILGAQVLPPDGLVDPRGSAEPVPVIQGVRQDPRRPLSQPAYPAPDIRAGNEGNADLEVYVLPNGRVGDARIVRSTGHARLDEAAIEEAKRNWRLLPATRDGVAIPQWHRVRVVFRITNR